MEETYFIKIAGKANVPEKVEIGHNYRLEIDASVTQEQRVDNEDGTFNVISKVEPITITIQKDNGKVLKGKDPRKNSVKFRKSCWKVADINHIDDERFYDFATIQSIGMLDGMAEEFKRRNQ